MSDPETKKLTLAIVCFGLPPYRQHAHGRFAREIPGVRLLTFNTHQDLTRDWASSQEPELIGLHDFSEGDKTNTSFGREWRRGGRMIEKLEQERPDAVIVNGYNDAGRLRVIRWCRSQGVPSFVWGDNNIASDRRRPAWKRAVRRFFVPLVMRQCTGAFGCGSLGRQYWEHYGVAPESVFVSPYEPDYRLVQELPQEKIDAALAKHNLSADRRRIVYCGRLTAVKRIDIALQAFVDIAERRPEWDFLVIGDGELRQELAALVPEALRERVQWTGFLGDQAEVSALYRAGDILALPSTFEPWALVVNEAVAAGMAVVTTDVVGAAAELVRTGVNGHVVPTDDLDAYRDALLDTTDPAKIDAMKAASAQVLADWRRDGDPVAGLIKALRYAGVMPEPSDGAS